MITYKAYNAVLLVSALVQYAYWHVRELEIHLFTFYILIGIWLSSNAVIGYMKQFEYEKKN